MLLKKLLNPFLNIYTLQKTESHLTNFIKYDLEIRNTDRARPYVFCISRLSKLARKNNRNLTPYELEKCKKILSLFMKIIV